MIIKKRFAELIRFWWVLAVTFSVGNAWAKQTSYVNLMYYLGSNMPTVFDFSNYNMDKITHILYAFADIKGQEAVINAPKASRQTEDGSQVLADHLGALLEVKRKNRHIKTGVSVLGDFGSMVDSKEGREKFVSSIVDIMKKYGFDFVDLDWEFPVLGFPELGVKGNPDDAKFMLELLKEFKRQFEAKLTFRAFVTMALPAPRYFLQHYNFRAIDPYIEFYNVMAYDYSGPHTDIAFHASNVYSDIPTRLSLDMTYKEMHTGGIPANKMVIGLPAYAILFKGCREKRLGSPYDKKATAEVGDGGKASLIDLQMDKIELHWDDVSKATWGWFESEKMLVSFESTRAVAEKAKYIESKNLRGSMVWFFAQDFKQTDPQSIITAITKDIDPQNMERSMNNINYPDSPFRNVKDPSYKFAATQLKSGSSSLTTPHLTLLPLILTIINLRLFL